MESIRINNRIAGMRCSEQIGMGACASQFKNQDVIVNLVNEKPVWCYVAFPVVGPSAGKRMVAVRGGEFFAVPQLFSVLPVFVNEGFEDNTFRRAA